MNGYGLNAVFQDIFDARAFFRFCPEQIFGALEFALGFGQELLEAGRVVLFL